MNPFVDQCSSLKTNIIDLFFDSFLVHLPTFKPFRRCQIDDATIPNRLPATRTKRYLVVAKSQNNQGSLVRVDNEDGVCGSDFINEATTKKIAAF